MMIYTWGGTDVAYYLLLESFALDFAIDKVGFNGNEI